MVFEEDRRETAVIHIFWVYSKLGFGSLPNLFFRAKAGSLIVPVLIPSRRNALYSGCVGGVGGSVLVARVPIVDEWPTFPFAVRRPHPCIRQQERASPCVSNTNTNRFEQNRTRRP